MSNEDNPFFLMGAMLGEKSGEVTDLRRRIEELEAERDALAEKLAAMQAKEKQRTDWYARRLRVD